MSYQIPLILFFLLYAWMARRDFMLALVFFAMALPAYLIRFDIGSLPSTALEGMFFILFLFWLAQKRFRPGEVWLSFKRAYQTPFFKPGLLLFVGATMSIFFAADIKAALGIWKAYFLEPLLFSVLLLDICKTKEDWKEVFLGLGGAVILLSVVAVIQRLTGWWSPTWEWTLPGSRRVTSLYTSPNALGLFVGPVTVLYLGWVWVEKRLTASVKLRTFQYSVILAGVLSLALSVSRGAIIAAACGVIMLGWRFWSRVKTGVLAGVIVLAVLLLPATRMALGDLASFQVASGQSRLALYQGTWELLRVHPVAGLGLANFDHAYEAVRPAEFTEILIYPHNIFLNFWSETGLTGVVAVIWIIVLVAKTARRSDDAWRFVLVSSLAVMLVHGLVDAPYFKNDLAMLTWILLAALVGYSGRGSDDAQASNKSAEDENLVVI